MAADDLEPPEQERFREIAEYASDLLLELGPDGRVLFVSPAVRELLGWSPEEFLERPPLDLVHPDDRAAVAAGYADLFRGEARTESLHRVRHRNGSWRWMHDTARSFRAADGERRIVVLGRDVTEQKRAEEALERHAELQARIARLSRELLAVDGPELWECVRARLPMAAELAGAERAQLVVFHPRDPVILTTLEWSAPGVPPDYAPVDPGAVMRFAWSASRVLAGETLVVRRVSDLPPAAEPERLAMAARGVRSSIRIPVRSEQGGLIGFQVFETVSAERSWSEREVMALQLVGEIFIGAIQRGRAEESLRESEERFRAIAEHATELVAEVDRYGVYRYASPSAESLLGCPPERIVGLEVRELLHPDDFEALQPVFASALERRGDARAVHRMRHRDGQWRWFESSARAYRAAGGDVRFVSIGRDITQRKEMEEAIERQLAVEQRVAALSRRFLALSAEEIDDAIREAVRECAELAGADRSYLHATEGLEVGGRPLLYEWCAPGVAGYAGGRRPWAEERLARGEILHFSDAAEMPQEAVDERQGMQQRGVKSLLAIPVRSADRTVGTIGFETVRGPCRWTQHDVTLLRLIGEILTSAVRRKRTEQALRESEAKLMQAQKLEAVGRLAGGIAHDFNNLLTVILGFSRPLLRELPEGDPLRADVAEIHDAAERAAGLTRQLLTFSRRQAMETKVVDLNRALSGLEGLLRRLVGEDVDLALELDPRLGGVRGDPHQFEQVVVNLAVNARDAMPDGGTLRIVTRGRDVDAERARLLGLRRPGPHAVVAVSDSGHGMDATVRSQIFDPFFTTKDPGKGTGLGLSIAYSVVEQSGGVIHVDGAPGKGTTFEIWLPTVPEAAVQGAPDERAGSLGGSETVLLVEDEPAVRRLARRILEGRGYRVLEAEDGAAALELAQMEPGPIDALLSDVVMPRLGGYELARRLRAARPGLAVLFTSGYPEERGLGPEGLPPGAALVAKPFTAETLLASLREVLGARATVS